MIKSISLTLPLLAAAAIAAVTGCNSLQITPQPPSTMPRAAGAPLPLRVGIAFDETASNAGAPGGGYGMKMAMMMNQVPINIGQSFADALRRSNLFQEVDYPISYNPQVLENIDVVITGNFGRAYHQDPALFPKAFLTGFLLWLPAPFIHYYDTYDATGDLAIKDKSGALVKGYSEKATVTADYQIFSEVDSHQQAPAISVQDLVAKLVEALVQDQASFAHISGADSGATEHRRRAPGAAADTGTGTNSGGAWWNNKDADKSH
jgi:hypothetical protein